MSLEPVEKSNAVNITAAIEQACQTHLEFATGWAYDRLEGIARTCNKCGVHLLDVKLASLLDGTSGILEWKCGQIITIFGSSHTAQRVTDRSASFVLQCGTVLKCMRYAARTAYNNITAINTFLRPE